MRKFRWIRTLVVVLLILGLGAWCGKGFALMHQRPGITLAWRSTAMATPATMPKPNSGDSYSDAAVLTHADLRGLQLTDWQEMLESNVRWDTATHWPSPLPAGFDPVQILELGKDPGLGVRSLHVQGITGRGVRVAFLDRPISLGHQEFGPNVQFVQVGYPAMAEMHGEATASLVSGKTVGVAPEADLTFYGIQWSIWTLDPLASTVERILDENRSLPPEQRIRAVGTSQEISRNKPGYDHMLKAVARARNEGVFFIWTGSREYPTLGLDRNPQGNPDDVNAYAPGMFLRNPFYANQVRSNVLWVPMDSRTVAAETGPEDYFYGREGGLSWAMPWMVGLYALAAQTKPSITPAEFYQVLQETGTFRAFDRHGKEYRLGPIANPPALIERLQRR